MAAPLTGIDVICDRRHGLDCSETGEEGLEIGARLGNGQQVGVGTAGCGYLVEQLPGNGIERHGGRPSGGLWSGLETNQSNHTAADDSSRSARADRLWRKKSC